MSRIAAAAAATAAAPRRSLALLVALLLTSAAALAVGEGGAAARRREATGKRGMTTTRRTKCSPPPRAAGGFGPGRRRTAAAARASSSVVPADDVDVVDASRAIVGRTIDGDASRASSVVGRMIDTGDSRLALSDRWESLLASSHSLCADAAGPERRLPLLLGLDERDAASPRVAPGGRPGRKLLLVAGGLATVVLALGASFLLGLYAGSPALAGVVIASEAAAPPSLAVFATPLAVGGRRAGVAAAHASMHLSVGFAAFRGSSVPEPAARYLREKAAPAAAEALKKMLLMELWRRVWTAVLPRMRKSLRNAAGGAAGLWARYCPTWIQRGTRSLFKKAVERRVQASAALVLGRVATGAGESLQQYWYRSGPPSFTKANAMAA